MNRDTQKVAVVCGASGGLGEIVAQMLQSRGFKVFGTMRDPSRKPDTSFDMLAMDAEEDTSVDACFDSVIDEAGSLDVVVNCVNEMMLGSVEEMSMDEVTRVYSVNVLGAIRISRAAFMRMRPQKSGVIINMSSLGGILPVPLLSAYTSSKFAIEAFSEALYQEARPHKVDVVIMQPVAMYMDRPDVGVHLKVAAGVGESSLTHRMVRRMGKDTRESKLTPQMVAAHIADIVESDRRKLRYPMDRAKMIGKLRRFAPQSVIDNMVGGIVKTG